MLATSSAGGLLRIILFEHLDRAGEVLKDTVYIHEVRVGPSWMDPIVKFLKDDILPEEKSEVEKYEEMPLGFGCLRSQVVQALLFWAVFTMYSL